MAINFPDNPTLNQTFAVGNKVWIWNGTVWTTDYTGFEESKFIVSDTPPTGPTEGKVWFNGTTGKFYIYYDNFWVETSSNEAGPEGPQGPIGPIGPAGLGLPAGGTTGQLLLKASNNDYETEWGTFNSTAPVKLNENIITANYTIPAGYNGLSAGPITIADGVTVTIADGSAWSIV